MPYSEEERKQQELEGTKKETRGSGREGLFHGKGNEHALFYWARDERTAEA